jgi:hypothetical protein
MDQFKACALPGGQARFKALDLLVHARAQKWNLVNHATVDRCFCQFNAGQDTPQSAAFMQALGKAGGIILTGTFFARAAHGNRLGARITPTFSGEKLPPVFHVPGIYQNERDVLLVADAFFENGEPRVVVEARGGRYEVSFASLDGVEAIPVDFSQRYAEPAGAFRLPFGKEVDAAQWRPDAGYAFPHYTSNISDFGLILRTASMCVKGGCLRHEAVYLESRPGIARLAFGDNAWPALRQDPLPST